MSGIDNKLLFVQKKESELQPSKITIVGYLSTQTVIFLSTNEKADVQVMF